jgi:hypothetical protein
MNQRVVLFAILGTFVTCFVGTCAVGTLTVVRSASLGISSSTKPKKVEPTPLPEEPMESAPPAVQLPPEEPAEELPVDAEDREPEYEAPEEGVGQFAVFHLGKPKVDPWGALQKAAKASGGKVAVYRDEAPDDARAPYLVLNELTTDDYEVVTGDTLDNGEGLTAADKAGLLKAKAASVFDVTTPVGASGMLEVSKVLGAFAVATGGILWDEEAQQYLSAASWQQRRVKTWEKGIPFIAMQHMVLTSDSDPGRRLQTAGLRHFGLPELRMFGVPAEYEDQGVELLNAVAQTMIEQGDPPLPGLMGVDFEKLRHAGQRKSLLDLCAADAGKKTQVKLTSAHDPVVPTLVVSFPGTGDQDILLEDGMYALFGQ